MALVQFLLQLPLAALQALAGHAQVVALGLGLAPGVLRLVRPLRAVGERE